MLFCGYNFQFPVPFILPIAYIFFFSVLATFEKHIKLHFLLFKNEPELKSTLPLR